ncbi:MAG TPA: DUF4440 domain-containing protein [Gemmatimonadales bacterium]|nr:DUF4440 domain-containing protein [Gemmatimonadales bacterium]
MQPTILSVLALSLLCDSARPRVDVAATTADTIRADVAQVVAGLNAHDARRTTAFDADDIVEIECNSPPMVGIEADRAGFAEGFARDPDWHVRLMSETVDVAQSGDLAVYRGVYHEDHGSAGALVTHRTNFIAEFRRQRDRSWKIAWYSVVGMEPSHPK